MTRSVLLHLIRSQTNRTYSTNISPGSHLNRLCTCQSAQGAISRPNYASPISGIQKKWYSESTSAEGDNKTSIGPRRGGDAKDGKYTIIVYHGPISSTIKKVKLFSRSTCYLSISLGPVINSMTSPDMNVILKGAVASTVIFLSALMTGALHWFVSPYIHKMRWKPGSDSFEDDLMTWLATFTTKTLKFSDIRPTETQRPFVMFKANDSFYFVDVDPVKTKHYWQN